MNFSKLKKFIGKGKIVSNSEIKEGDELQIDGKIYTFEGYNKKSKDWWVVSYIDENGKRIYQNVRPPADNVLVQYKDQGDNDN